MHGSIAFFASVPPCLLPIYKLQINGSKKNRLKKFMCRLAEVCLCIQFIIGFQSNQTTLLRLYLLLNTGLTIDQLPHLCQHVSDQYGICIFFIHVIGSMDCCIRPKLYAAHLFASSLIDYFSLYIQTVIYRHIASIPHQSDIALRYIIM